MRLVPGKIWAVMTIRQEADSEPYEGKVAVAEVIRNRAETYYFSDGTIEGTVLKPLQFSGWNTSDPNRIRVSKLDDSDYLTQEAIRAYEEAFTGRSNRVLGANLYHAKTMIVYPNWSLSSKVTKITEIGNHIFYKENR